MYLQNYFKINQKGKIKKRKVTVKKRKEILERDNFKCQWGIFCKKKVRYLQVHHVDSDGGNNKDSNLITLCIDCHKLFHTTFDYRVEEEVEKRFNAVEHFLEKDDLGDTLNKFKITRGEFDGAYKKYKKIMSL